MVDMIFIKRNLILFGAFLSTFILLLAPNVGCANSIVQKDEISNFKNIIINDFKKIKTILNLDFGCKDSKAAYSEDYPIVYDILYSIADILAS